MEELAALVETAGGEVIVTLIQNRPAPEPRSFIGDGKIAEMKQLIGMHACDMAVFDNELSPSQMRVLSEELGVKVLDRSGLILDIFAGRARTREGRLQVELAQYQYLLPRLTGMWTHLVRQTASGGSSPIGTRGPGETQLETDRRHIRRKIQKLQEELSDVRRVRDTQRRLREKNSIPMVALVGYTNAGKSTLLNTRTDGRRTGAHRYAVGEVVQGGLHVANADYVAGSAFRVAGWRERLPDGRDDAHVAVGVDKGVGIA